MKSSIALVAIDVPFASVFSLRRGEFWRPQISSRISLGCKRRDLAMHPQCGFSSAAVGFLTPMSWISLRVVAPTKHLAEDLEIRSPLARRESTGLEDAPDEEEVDAREHG